MARMLPKRLSGEFLVNLFEELTDIIVFGTEIGSYTVLVDNLGHCMLFGCENSRFSRIGDSSVNDSALTL